MADRLIRIVTKQTAVTGRVPTGTTGVESNFIKQGELAQNTSDKKLFGYDGSSIFEFGSNSFLSLTGGTINGNTRLIGRLSADTIISGSTNLYSIFAPIGSSTTIISNGINTYTGGTSANPTVNVSALTINSLFVSGSTTLESVSATGATSFFRSIEPIADNTYVLGSTSRTWANIHTREIRLYDSSGNDAISIKTPSALSVNPDPAWSLTLPLFTGATNTIIGVYDGSSNTSNTTWFDLNSGNNINIVKSGNISGGTFLFSLSSDISVNNLISSGLSQLATTTTTLFSGGTVSGGTIFSGSTNIGNLFGSQSQQAILTSQILTKANLSGATFTGAVIGTSLSATTLSGGTILSGSTNLNNIFLNQASLDGTINYVPYYTAAKALSASPIYYDTTTGRVGINTVSPSSTFHVNGGLRFSSSVVGNSGSAASPTYAWSVNSNMGMYYITGDNIGWSTSSTERMRLTSDGILAVNNLSATTATATTFYSSGISVGTNIAPAAFLDITAGTTSRAGIRLGGGVSPSAPINGDIWNLLSKNAIVLRQGSINTSFNTSPFIMTGTGAASNTVAQTSIVGGGVGTLTLPANFFTVGKTLTYKIEGYFNATGSPNYTFRINLGSTVVNTTVIGMSTTTNGYVSITGQITCRTTGVSGTIFSQGDLRLSTSNAFPMVNTAAITVDTTISQAIDLTVQMSVANANNNVQGTNLFITIINPTE